MEKFQLGNLIENKCCRLFSSLKWLHTHIQIILRVTQPLPISATPAFQLSSKQYYYKEFIIFILRDEICRQEFQYAKKTVKKPVIPVVVGSSFDWMMTVVGLLIAGEIYIHFSNKDVQKDKMTELLKAIKKSVPQVRLPDSMGSVQGGLDKNVLKKKIGWF